MIETKVQPAAAEIIGEPISHIVSASGYACQQRLGNTSGKQSEHSFANAFDVSAVTTASGRTLDVLTGWGPTARDLNAQFQVATGARFAGGDAAAWRHEVDRSR
jgi:hypothetical protein